MIAIGFDFDHTLGIDNKLERTVFLQLAEDLGRVKGVGYDEGHAAAAIDAALSAYRRGMGSIDEVLAQTFETVVGPGQYADAIARFRAQCIARVGDFVRPLPGVEKTLAELALRGIPTAILTNGWTPLQERKAEAIGFFGPVLVSDAIGVRKPERRAFAELCAALDAPAPNVWYVGDDPAADVCGSLAAGLRGIWFDWEKHAYPADLPRPSAVIDRMEELLALTERAQG